MWFPGSKCPKCDDWGYIKPLLQTETYNGTYWVCRSCGFEWPTKWTPIKIKKDK